MGKTPDSSGGDAGAKRPSTTRSLKAGLTWPIPRVHRRILERKTVKRVSAGAPVYIAAALERVASEILAVAVEQTTNAGRKRVTPADLLSGIRSDAELNSYIGGVKVLVGDRIKARAAASAILSSADKAAKVAAA